MIPGVVQLKVSGMRPKKAAKPTSKATTVKPFPARALTEEVALSKATTVKGSSSSSSSSEPSPLPSPPSPLPPLAPSPRSLAEDYEGDPPRPVDFALGIHEDDSDSEGDSNSERINAKDASPSSGFNHRLQVADAENKKHEAPHRHRQASRMMKLPWPRGRRDSTRRIVRNS